MNRMEQFETPVLKCGDQLTIVVQWWSPTDRPTKFSLIQLVRLRFGRTFPTPSSWWSSSYVGLTYSVNMAYLDEEILLSPCISTSSRCILVQNKSRALIAAFVRRCVFSTNPNISLSAELQCIRLKYNSMQRIRFNYNAVNWNTMQYNVLDWTTMQSIRLNYNAMH